MAQQLNLYHPRFAPPSLRVSARVALAAVLASLGLGMALAQGLHLAARHAVGQARAAEAANLPLRERLLASARTPPADEPDHDAELYMLRVMDAGQRRIRAALDAGVAGSNEGHSAYLVALAQHASPRVWITGFSVAEGGEQLTLQGRLSAAHALTDYLRGLNAEPRFKGRPFAQVTLAAVNGPDGQAGYTEFSLRASPPPDPAAAAPTSAAPAAAVPTAPNERPGLQAQR